MKGVYMSYNTLNYTEQGGAKTVVGGEIDVTGDFKLDGVALAKAENQADSTATTVAGLKDDVNALLAKLIAAGLMASE